MRKLVLILAALALVIAGGFVAFNHFFSFHIHAKAEITQTPKSVLETRRDLAPVDPVAKVQEESSALSIILTPIFSLLSLIAGLFYLVLQILQKLKELRAKAPRR